MLKINVITIFPDMFRSISDFGITGRTIDKGLLQLRCWDPRDFTQDRGRRIDDRPYGGGPGMVMRPEPLANCIDKIKASATGPVIYLSPQGERLDQKTVTELSELADFTLLSGRYEGVDERILQTRVDREISIGDYVLSGGELPAMVMVEAVSRLLPGALGNTLSCRQDSFFEALLDCPHYTRPRVFERLSVPEVLLSGDHEQIRRWRLKHALVRTRTRRPDMLENSEMDEEKMNLLKTLWG